MKNILITGGLGFIGSCFVISQIKKGNFVVNLDKMTYAANKNNVAEVENDKNYRLIKGDICSEGLVYDILNDFKIDQVVNFAAESHVDNSISDAKSFIHTNITGVFSLLQANLRYFQESVAKRDSFRLLHVSTDEVFGSLGKNDPIFTENSNYRPNSPYSASKAASDHLVRAWHQTYGFPVITTNCSNNFGPRQHQEKLIPTVINACLNNKNIPIYGDGKNIRDWIFVEDHCRGIDLALQKGKAGQVYCFGGENEITNVEIVNMICTILDEEKPRQDGASYKKQISFVKDRQGHDYRYAIDNAKAKRDLGFEIERSFEENLKDTIMWYLKQK